MTSRITIKAGETFVENMTWSTGSPLAAVDLTGYTITSKIRKKGDADADDPVAVITCTPDADQSANTGVFEVDFGDTSGWPFLPLAWDIKFVSASTKKITETIIVDVSRAESR